MLVATGTSCRQVFGIHDPGAGDAGQGDDAPNGFRDVKLYALYFAGMALLCLHLGHGAASWLQTLGLRHPKYRVDHLGTIVGWTLFVGYMVPPTAVLVGFVG